MRRAVGARRARVAGVGAEHVEHVAEVEADRTHVQLHLRVLDGGHLALRHDAQVADRAARVEVQPDRPRGRQRRLGEARHAADPDAHDDLELERLAADEAAARDEEQRVAD